MVLNIILFFHLYFDSILLPAENVVSGRIINGYCQGDWLLRFLYRSSSVNMRIAGLMPIDWQDRRMFNFDLSDIVAGIEVIYNLDVQGL